MGGRSVQEIAVIVSLFLDAHPDDLARFGVKTVSAVFDFFVRMLRIKLDLTRISDSKAISIWENEFSF
jgi:hypothetical protein